MTTPHAMFAAFAVLGALWTLVWAWIVVPRGRSRSWEAIEYRLGAVRRRLLPVAVATIVAATIVSAWSWPYPWRRIHTVGVPAVSVRVTGTMWQWMLDQGQVPAGVPIEFVVTSGDVNHGFAIYAPDGALLTQVQAMPGYTNRLIYRFNTPGTYTIRCLEYCGLAHIAMISTLIVVSSGSGAAR